MAQKIDLFNDHEIHIASAQPNPIPLETVEDELSDAIISSKWCFCIVDNFVAGFTSGEVL